MAETFIIPSGEILATDVSFEEYLTQFDGQSVEWVNGVIIQMSPVSIDHIALVRFLISLFDNLLTLTRSGEVFFEPMAMRPLPNLPSRSPDIQVVLNQNMHIVKQNLVDGPADLVIEVVSPESHRRDRVEKFAEYEKGGIPEYWILDPIRRETLFYVRNADGIYEPVEPDENGIYRGHVLPQLRLSAAIFWQIPLPRGPEITKLVEAMLKS